MIFTEEVRHSATKRRSATITPNSAHRFTGGRLTYDVILTEQGRLISRTFRQRASTITKARTVARLWCQ